LKPFRIPFALFAVFALLLLWGGTASADDSPSADCLADPSLATCLPSGDGLTGDGEGDTTGTGVGDDSTGTGVGDDSTDTQDGDASGDLGDGTAPGGTTLPTLPGDTAALPPVDDPGTVGGGEGTGSAAEDDDQQTGGIDETGNDEAGNEPDTAEGSSCIGDAVDQFLVDLQGALGEDADGLVTQIQTALGSSDPTAVLTFLQGLPALVEGAGADITAEDQAILTQAAEDIAACLPAPPAVQPPPSGEPPTAEPPTKTPVVQPAVHYENCDDARARGATPVYSTDPGYTPALDADGDGIGCEDDTIVPAVHATGRPQLAYTGVEFAPQLEIGGVLLLLGTGLLLAARRRA